MLRGTEPFTIRDWHFVETQIHAVSAAIRSKGETFCKSHPSILPPIPMSQVETFEREVDLRLPSDLVDFITGFSGGWDWGWCIDGAVPIQGLAVITECGNREVPFLGLTESRPIVSAYRELQTELGSWNDHQNSIDNAANYLPLHMFEGGGGNYSAMRLTENPVRIDYLDHEANHFAGPHDQFGHGFRTFMLRWATVGFISLNNFAFFAFSTLLKPAPSIELTDKGQKWMDWLMSASPPALPAKSPFGP